MPSKSTICKTRCVAFWPISHESIMYILHNVPVTPIMILLLTTQFVQLIIVTVVHAKQPKMVGELHKYLTIDELYY